MIKILIADDHPIVRRGLKELINDETDMRVECEASSAAEVINELRNYKIDVIILDISMPGKSGLDLIADLKKEFSEKPILVLSALAEEIFAKRTLKIGAQGFLNKESAPDELVAAIRKVHAGKRYISYKLAEQMADEIANDSKEFIHDKLSSREFEVLRLLGNGKTVGEVAKTLHLSVTTISTYRARILSKLGLKNNAKIIQFCINEKLISD